MDDHHHPNQLIESIKMHFSFQNYHCHHYYQYYVDILVLNLNETNSVCSILSLLTAIKGCISEFDIFLVERALSSQPTPHQVLKIKCTKTTNIMEGRIDWLSSLVHFHFPIRAQQPKKMQLLAFNYGQQVKGFSPIVPAVSLNVDCFESQSSC